MKSVRVRYYAVLREQRGASEEDCRTAAETPAELYGELRRRHGFSLPADRVRAAINDEFAGSGTRLKDGDSVVFLPPVAGG